MRNVIARLAVEDDLILVHHAGGIFEKHQSPRLTSIQKRLADNMYYVN